MQPNPDSAGLGGQPAEANAVVSGRRAIRPAVWVALPWIAGLLAGHVWSPSTEVCLAVAGTLAIAAVVTMKVWRHTGAAVVVLLAAVVWLGAARVSVWRDGCIDPSLIAQVAGRQAEITGRVVTDPRLKGRRWRFGVMADTVLTTGPAALGRVGIMVTADTAVGAARIGERVRIRGVLKPAPWPAAPGLFDYGGYLRRSGFAALMSARSAGALTILPRPVSRWVSFWDDARSYARRAIRHGLTPRQAGIVTGLVLGDRSGLPRDVLDQFQDCGVVHILAVSGLHVGMILFGVGWALRMAFGWRRWIAGILIVLAWSYAALTGGNPPVVRASTMATVLLLAPIAGRSFDPWNALAVSALVTLSIDPPAVLGASFQLSYAAVAGILWVADALQRQAGGVPLLRRTRAARYAVGLVAATVAAQTFTWPLMAHHFGRVPLLGLVASPRSSWPLRARSGAAWWGCSSGGYPAC